MNIYIVIPAFNEGRRIEKVLEDLKGINLPIIVVDDGSKDSTYDIVKKHKVILVRHKINLGKGAAIKTGFETAFLKGADAAIMMDSDGQHKPSDLYRFIEKIELGKYDIVFGSRNLGMGVPLVRFLGNKIASVLISLLFGVYISDSLCGFRAITTNGFKKMRLESLGYEIEIEMIIEAKKARLRYCEVPIETVYYDKFKGVTLMNAFSIAANIFKWRIYK